MNRILSVRQSGNIMVMALLAMLVVHLLILLRVVPYEFVWGGQIDSASSLVLFEGIAMGMTLLFILIIAMRVGYIQLHKFKRAAVIGGWFMVAYFLLNTLGNLASGVTLEKLLFTPVTVILTILAFRIAMAK